MDCRRSLIRFCVVPAKCDRRFWPTRRSRSVTSTPDGPSDGPSARDHVYVAGAFYQAFLDQAPADGLRRLYVALTRAMHSLTVTLPRYVKHTQLSRVIGADATGLLPAFAEACTQAGVDRETDPDK